MAVLKINDLVVDFETDQGIVQAIDHLTLSRTRGRNSRPGRRERLR
jgi:ABC-type dipeptide/oligopeptide/nickel transport system ATPase component